MIGWMTLGVFAQTLSAVALPTQDEDLSVYVNPFIGTAGPDGTGTNSGDTFPGVSVPFGVVKLGPDTTEMNPSTNAFAGYTPDGNGMFKTRALIYKFILITQLHSHCIYLLP